MLLLTQLQLSAIDFLSVMGAVLTAGRPMLRYISKGAAMHARSNMLTQTVSTAYTDMSMLAVLCATKV